MLKRTKSMRNIFILLLFSSFAFINCDNAGGSGSAGPVSGAVSGHVYLEGSLKPITQVVVSCEGMEDTTQKSGRYEIGNIPAGSRTVIAAHPYYETYSSTVMIRADQTTTLDIFLRYDESDRSANH